MACLTSICLNPAWLTCLYQIRSGLFSHLPRELDNLFDLCPSLKSCLEKICDSFTSFRLRFINGLCGSLLNHCTDQQLSGRQQPNHKTGPRKHVLKEGVVLCISFVTSDVPLCHSARSTLGMHLLYIELPAIT